MLQVAKTHINTLTAKWIYL